MSEVQPIMEDHNNQTNRKRTNVLLSGLFGLWFLAGALCMKMPINLIAMKETWIVCFRVLIHYHLNFFTFFFQTAKCNHQNPKEHHILLYERGRGLYMCGLGDSVFVRGSWARLRARKKTYFIFIPSWS